MMAGMFRVLLMVALLAACSQATERETRKPPSRMKEAARAAADQPPKRTIYRFENGELVVIDIATLGPRGYADSQKCFLWRDTELKSSSLQCPADAAADIPLGHAEPEKNVP